MSFSEKDFETNLKLNKALGSSVDKMVEAAHERRHKEFHYWMAVLEILWLDPSLLWDDSEDSFVIKDLQENGSNDNNFDFIWSLYNKLK